MAHEVVDRRQIEVHLAGVLRLEGSHLQVDDDKATQSYMVKKQVELVIFTAYFERILAANESEADTKLKEEFAKVLQ